jgi:hypothetical protein
LLYDARENNETLKLEDMEDLLDYAENEEYIVLKMEEAIMKAFPSAAAAGALKTGNPPESPKPNRQQRRSAGKKATSAK